MKNDKEIVGTLKGFDDFVNMVLEDVTEFESTPEGKRVTKLDQILLNGNNITMVNMIRYPQEPYRFRLTIIFIILNRQTALSLIYFYF